MWAARSREEEAIELLLKYNANIEAVNKYGCTPLILAVMSGKKEAIELLLKHNANIEAVDEYGYTPLILAARNGKEEAIELLLKHNVNIEAVNKDGYTPLILAARNGHKEVIEVLLKNNANIEAVDNTGKTALDYVQYVNNKEIIQLLFSSKSKQTSQPSALVTPKPNLSPSPSKLNTKEEKVADKDSKKLNPVIDDEKHSSVSHNNEQLIKAAEAGDVAKILFYINKGANIEARDRYSSTPLMWAARHGKKEAIEVLLKHNANIEAVDKGGKTALDYAKSNEHKEIIQLLLSSKNKQTSQPEALVSAEPNLSSPSQLNNTTSSKTSASLEQSLATLQPPSTLNPTPPTPPTTDTIISPKELNSEEKTLELSIVTIKQQLAEQQRILQEYKWIERFKDVDTEKFGQITNDTLKLVSATVDINQISQRLNNLDEQIMPLTLIQQKEEDRLKKIQYILNNDNLRDYYVYFKTLFSSTYIGCGAISSSLVVCESSKYAKISSLIGEIVTHLPMVGIAGTVITKISDIVDKRYGLSYANKILAIFSSNEEMSEISDLLTIKMTNAKYQEICALNKVHNQSILTRYKDKVQNWLKGINEKSLAEKMAEEDLTIIMEAIASEKMPLVKRTKADITEHAEEIVSLIMDIIKIRENGNNLSDIQINVGREEDAVSISSVSVASYVLSPSSSSNKFSSPSPGIDIEEMRRKYDEDIAQLKEHIELLKSSHQSLEVDRERFVRLEQESAKIRRLEEQLKKKADKDDDVEFDNAAGGMGQLTIGKGINSRAGNQVSPFDYRFVQLESRLGYVEHHLSGVSDRVAYEHVTIHSTNEEPSSDVREAFGLKERPSPKIVKPVATRTGFDIREDATTIAENTVDKLLEQSKSQSPNPNSLPKRFANNEVRKDLITFLSDCVLTQLGNITLAFKQKDQIINKLAGKLSIFIASYNEEGLSLTLKPEEFANSAQLRLNITQAVSEVVAAGSRNFK